MCVCVRVYTVKSVSNTCCYCCRYHLVALFYLPHLFVPRGLTCFPLVFPFVDFHGAKVLISLCFYPCYFQPLYSLSLVLLLLGCLSTLPGVLIYCGLVKCRQRLHFNPHQPPPPILLSWQRFVHFCRVAFVLPPPFWKTLQAGDREKI